MLAWRSSAVMVAGNIISNSLTVPIMFRYTDIRNKSKTQGVLIMPKQQERHRNNRGDSEVIAHATEILARRCCGESVAQIHADLVRRGTVKTCYGTFSRWVWKMETKQLDVPLVPKYLQLRGILQGTGPSNGRSRIPKSLKPSLESNCDGTQAPRIRKVVG